MTTKPLALITGATSGIGLALSQLLLRKNYQLILVGRSEEKLQTICRELNDPNILDCLCYDLVHEDAAQKVYQACQEKNYCINLLVNNAGVGVFGEFVKQPIASINNMLKLNILSLTAMCHLFAKDMTQQQGGKILNIASTAAFQPVPYLGCYAASKSYVLHFSEALNAELKENNINVYCLCPGATATNFFNLAGIKEQNRGVFAKHALMPVDVVAACAWRLINSAKVYAIVGKKNWCLAFLNRFVPRKVVTFFSRLLFKPMLR